MTTVRDFKVGERCRINGYLVQVERHARQTSFVRVVDQRLPGDAVVQLHKSSKAAKP